MFDWITNIVTILGSLALARLLGKTKEIAIPLALSYMMFIYVVGQTTFGSVHFVTMVLKFIAVAVMCNGLPIKDFGRNPAWKSFMIFCVYMYVVAFFGYYVGEASYRYLNAWLFSFASGYFVVMWATKKDGRWRRLLIGVLVAASLVTFYYLRHGGLSAANVAASGRATMDIDSFGTLSEDYSVNENFMALCIASFLPFLLIIFLRARSYFIPKYLAIVAFVVFVCLSLMLIRTGSRNGALALIVCGWFVMTSSHGIVGKIRNIVLGAICVAGLIYGAAVTMENTDTLRAFQYTATGQSGRDRLDEISSGRIGMYIDWYDQMSPLQVCFGSGYTILRTARTRSDFDAKGRIGMANYHSLFMGVFYHTGIVGSILFVIFVVRSLILCRRLGERGRMALLFIGTWLITGVGETAGLNGALIGVLGGIGMGLLTQQKINCTELIANDQNRYMCIGYPTMQH